MSGLASALSSICSGELLPLTGLNTLKHEASWSSHDNWFYNTLVAMSSTVSGPVSPSKLDEFEMKNGGSVEYSTAGTDLSEVQQNSIFASGDGGHQHYIVTSGVIDALDESTLVLRTDVARHVMMSLPSDYTIAGHTATAVAAIRVGDTVGIYWDNNDRKPGDAPTIRIYRDASFAVTQPSAVAANTTVAGLELRQVVDSIELTPLGSVRLVYGADETTLQVPAESAVTLIEAATFSQLQQHSGNVRVTARQAEDGSIVVRSIEIHK